MSTIQEKLEAATQEYEAAQQHLNEIRTAYESGPGRAWKEAKERKAVLQQKITTHEQAATDAEAKFKELFAKAGHDITKDVRKALNEKNDENAITDELRAALQQLEGEMDLMSEEVSVAAQNLQGAYQTAADRRLKMETFRALAESGEAIARVLAMRPYRKMTPWGKGDDLHERMSSPEEVHMNFVLNELRGMAQMFEAEGGKYRKELGGLDLGSFSTTDILTPAQAHQRRMLRESQQQAKSV